MKTSFLILGELSLLVTLTYALPVPIKREVPQEHSHQKILTSVTTSLQLNNPDQIIDPVFGLLGDEAAAEGAGKITDVDCLQQAVADQAFTNAKAANNVEAMTNALIYRALERNTGAVGETSPLCTSLKAVNPEVAALTQHQDPASEGAAAHNKHVALTLAVQIAKIGGNPQSAIESGTFQPGHIGDPTAKGFGCDNANDPIGCIFTQNLLVPDVTADEIKTAVAAAGSTKGSAGSSSGSGSSSSTSTTSSTSTSGSDTSAPAATTSAVSSSCVAVSSNSGANTGSGSTTTTSGSSNSGSDSNTSTTSTSSSSASGSSLNLGECSGSADIVFGFGFDGRTTDSFEPADEAAFNHGSAQDIAIIADFICQQLQDRCKAPQATINACNNGLAAATASGVTGQAAADAFNAALK